MWSRIRWALASAFLTLQALAIVAGPAPGSYSMGKVYPWIQPYLRALHLENYWGFFAPDPHAGTVLRGLVEDADGELHVVKMTEALRRNDGAYLRMSSLYYGVGRSEGDRFAQSVARALCRRHAELDPQRVQLMVGSQLPISIDAWREGARPLGLEHMAVEYQEPFPCPNGAATEP